MITNQYYKNKSTILKNIFNTDNIKIDINKITIDNVSYRVENDVIILHEDVPITKVQKKTVETFGQEWTEFNRITTEHYSEFENYFDIVNIKKLEGKNVIDFGCGIGRWSKILADKVNLNCLILFDYSNSIYIARENFREYNNVIFFKGDIEKIDFAKDSFSFFLCLGVLHHLPKREKNVLKKIHHSSKEGLIYLYYNLENRIFLYKILFHISNFFRKILSRSRFHKFNIFLSYLITIFFYYPFIWINRIFSFFNLHFINLPLSFYLNSSFFRVRQDAFDRFFTNIEYRSTKKQIFDIYGQYYKNIVFSNKPPYWHFKVKSNPAKFK